MSARRDVTVLQVFQTTSVLLGVAFGLLLGACSDSHELPDDYSAPEPRIPSYRTEAAGSADSASRDRTRPAETASDPDPPVAEADSSKMTRAEMLNLCGYNPSDSAFIGQVLDVGPDGVDAYGDRAPGQRAVTLVRRGIDPIDVTWPEYLILADCSRRLEWNR